MGVYHFVGVGPLTARSRAALGEAVGKAAEDFVGKAQAATPVRTGTLRASIHVASMSKDGSNGSQAAATAKVATGGEANDYAVFVEEGTSKMAAQPYMRPTLAQEGPVLAEYIARSVRAAF